MPEPATGAYVGIPQPLVAAFGGVATTILVGRVSEKFTPVIVTELGLVMVNTSGVTPPSGMGLVEKVLSMRGDARAVRVAEP